MILRTKTELDELKAIDPQYFEDMIKIVIDRERKLVAVGAEMHSDMGIELYDMDLMREICMEPTLCGMGR